MKIFGHPWIISEDFIEVNSIEKLKQTKSASIILINDIKHSVELLEYCQKEMLPTAVRVDSIKLSIFANLFNVRYIIASPGSASEIQALAQHYLFDAQVLVEINKEDDIERYAKMGIDAVMFPAAIVSMEKI